VKGLVEDALDVVLDPFSGVAVTAVADRLAVSVPVVLHCGRGERALCSCKRLNSTQRLAIESLTFPEMEANGDGPFLSSRYVILLGRLSSDPLTG
jgi:hypothetical protein